MRRDPEEAHPPGSREAPLARSRLRVAGRDDFDGVDDFEYQLHGASSVRALG